MYSTRGQPEQVGALVDEALFESDLVTVGFFRAGPDHPRFEDAGPITGHTFVFPRTAVMIEHEGAPPFIADPSVVTCYNPGQPYRRSLLDTRGDACEWFSVREDVLKQVIQRHDPGAVSRESPFPAPYTPCDPRIYALQRQIFRHLESACSPDSLAVEEATLRLMESIAGSAYSQPSDGPAECPPTPSEVELGEAVRAHLVERYHRNESLEDIAAAVDRSLYYVCRVFRRYTGTTIHQFRHQLRLRRSLDLVAERSSDISRVAFQLGFSSHSHFTAAFRDSFGITPSEFRRRPTTRRVREYAHRAGAA